MTQAEKYSWASLIATGAIYWFFQMRMLDGLEVLEQSADALFELYVTIVIVFIIAEATIAGVIAVRQGNHNIEKDERDLAIEARAERNAMLFLVVVINILIVQLLADKAYPGHVFPRFDFTDPATMFFILFSVLIGATLVQRISTLVLYGWLSGRR